MKAITNGYKNQIKEIGREITANVTYTISGTSYTLGEEELSNVSMHYEGGILKSVMKQLDLETNTDIPIGTEINAQFGLMVNGAYEYIDFGNYIVYSSEKQEDTSSYKIICYDKLLYSMKDYENMNLTYPITIRNYINEICTYLGLTFANYSDTFPNYDKEIENELYLDSDGNSLEYTFRDVLDQLAQVTASTICINNDDELELRYINDTNDTIDEEYFKDVNVNFGEVFGPINTITFKRSADSDVISYPDPLPLNPIEIVISDNLILNDDNRADYFEDIYNQLNGLTYSMNDFSSTGITYYELCDKYSASIGENIYTCIMFNDEINITQGLEENIHTERPEDSDTDYNTTTSDDRSKLRTDLIVNKQEGKITAVVDNQEDLEDRMSRAEVTIRENGVTLEIKTAKIDDNGNSQSFYSNGAIYTLTTDLTFQSDKTYYIKSGTGYVEATVIVGSTIPANTYYEKSYSDNINYEINENGFITTDNNTGFKAQRTATGDYYYENDDMTGKYTKDGAVFKDLGLFGSYYYGIEEDVDVETFKKDDAMFMAQMYTAQWTDKDGINHSEEGFGHFFNN